MTTFINRLFPASRNGSNTARSYLPVFSKSEADVSRDSMDSMYYDEDELAELNATSQTRSQYDMASILIDFCSGSGDGLIVPFALAAGMSLVADDSTAIITLAGFATLVATAVVLGFLTYVQSNRQLQSYNSTKAQVDALVRDAPKETAETVKEIVERTFPGLSSTLTMCVQMHVASMKKDDQVSYLLQHQYNLQAPRITTPAITSITLAIGSFVGGFFTLLPYLIFSRHVTTAVISSAAITTTALFFKGVVQEIATARQSGRDTIGWLSAAVEGVRSVSVGFCAAVGSILIVRALAH